MSERVERIIKDYPNMIMERNCLREQIMNFQGITEGEIINAMNFSSPEGERVQTSNVSDKTASIAAAYRERVCRINREWLDHLARKLLVLEEEIGFFHSALHSLPPELATLMWDLAVERLTWDSVEGKYHISRFTVSKYRKKALRELGRLYAAHDSDMADYLFS